MMTFEETKKWVFENLISKKGKLIPYKIRFSGGYIKETKPTVYDSIIYHSNHLSEDCMFQQRIYDILNDIHEVVMCDFCKKNSVTFFKYSQGYAKCCSNSCAQQHSDTRRKIEKTNLGRYGAKSPLQSSIVQEKAKNTNLERRGVEWVLCDPEAHIKARETNIEKYGVENCSQREEVKELKRQKCIESFGVDCNFKAKEINDKIKQTNMEKYGVSCISKSSYAKKKSIETSFKKYGHSHHFKSSKWMEKNFKYKFHNYALPSGKIIKLQGYEPRALDYLLTKYTEEEILHKKTDVPKLMYIGDDNKEHRYYPDFYIPKENLVIEVKSDWTYGMELLKNLFKQDIVLENGYKYMLMVL